MRAVFGFTPWESKRLLGKAVAALPEVAHALEHAQIVIGHGSTNVYVAEEIMGDLADTRDRFVSGQVINGTLCQTEPAEKPAMIRLVKGKPAGTTRACSSRVRMPSIRSSTQAFLMPTQLPGPSAGPMEPFAGPVFR